MAEIETNSLKELDSLAFQIFSNRAASNPRAGEGDAVNAFRAAEAFLATRKKVRSGELSPKPPEGPQLSECCAPNLPKTHPHNLVAKVWQDRSGGNPVPGDLAKVGRIHAWLAKNPAPTGDNAEREAQEQLNRINREFDLGWNDVAVLNTARAIFPAYCK